MKPIEWLFDAPDLPRLGLPPALAALYGGDFGLSRRTLYANFVSSTDGVVALAEEGESGRVISGDSEPDRFIMGLLRACADAVVIGAGTFRKAAGDLWYPESIYPAQAQAFADLRQQLQLRDQPLLVVVTASGYIDPTQPALRDCLIVTTPPGELRLRGVLPAGARLAVFDAQRIEGPRLLDLLHAQGLQRVLTEGGPTLVGQLLQEGIINELFLTTSPRLFGRKSGDARKSLADGVNLGGRVLKLCGVRRHESHLFLRYAL
jgi:riboflavin biosynthesis pyrimidine reductase